MNSAPLVQASHPTVHLAGYPVGRSRHVCAFVNGLDEEYGIMAPFVKEGLERGERVLQIVNPARTDDHARRMREGGVDVDAPATREQLSVVPWDQAYLLDGRFDGDRMLKMLEGVVADREAKGFPLSRCMGNMEWALSGAPGVESLLEYEARVNLVSPKHPDVFVCFYDLNKFSARFIVDVMRTHPAVIIGGILQENPYFVPPERMLRELEARRRSRKS